MLPKLSCVQKLGVLAEASFFLPSFWQVSRLPNIACTRRVGVCALSSSLRGLRRVPAKWRCLVPPTRRERTPLGALRFVMDLPIDEVLDIVRTQQTPEKTWEDILALCRITVPSDLWRVLPAPNMKRD